MLCFGNPGEAGTKRIRVAAYLNRHLFFSKIPAPDFPELTEIRPQLA